MQQTGKYIIFFNSNTKSLWCVNNIHVVNLNYTTNYFFLHLFLSQLEDESGFSL